MDGERFDQITRLLAATASRRAALQVLGAGLAVGMGGALRLRGTHAQDRPGCTRPNDFGRAGTCTLGSTCPANSTCAAVNPNQNRCICTAPFCNCDTTDGCETNLTTDLNNCGRCGNACPARANATRTCVSGDCGFTCNPGFGNCNPNPNDGCETNLNTNVNNCGACGRACTAPPNGTATCTAGACGFVCNPGFTLCGGACVNLVTDVANCGSCGNVCPQPTAGTCQDARTCVNGTCGFTPSPVGTQCRAPAGPCDAQEVCNGVSTDCPPDRFLPAGTVCRAASEDCELDATCSGAAASCPANPVAPDGAPCGDGGVCCAGSCAPGGQCCANVDCGNREVCINGACICESECCADSDCHAGEVCTEGTCVCGSECCSDGDCGSDEVCTDGTCVCANECCSNADCGGERICTDGTCVENKVNGNEDENAVDEPGLAVAGNGGVAAAQADGGAVAIGDVNSGGNAGNAISGGDTVGTVAVDGGDVANATGLTVTVDGGTGIADASGGDGNLAEVLGP